MSLKGIFPIDRWNFNSQTILAGLQEEDYNRLFVHAREEKYKKGEIVFREGAEARGIFYIRSGKVKKYKIDNIGKEHIFYVANAGELIGYHAVLAAEPYPDAAVTLEETTLTFIPLDDFLFVLDRSPGLARRLLKILSHEFGVFINNMSVFAQRPVRERVAIALIILREKYKPDTAPGEPVVINVPRDVIANMAGTTRENIARFLTEFRRDGIVASRGRKIVIVNLQKLVALTNYT